MEKQLQEIQKEKKDADVAITELRQRVMSLQQELDTSEAVQKDFVRLSQSLQVIKIILTVNLKLSRYKVDSNLSKKHVNKEASTNRSRLDLGT